jgi:hypothetical protein
MVITSWDSVRYTGTFCNNKGSIWLGAPNFIVLYNRNYQPMHQAYIDTLFSKLRPTYITYKLLIISNKASLNPWGLSKSVICPEFSTQYSCFFGALIVSK